MSAVNPKMEVSDKTLKHIIAALPKILTPEKANELDTILETASPKSFEAREIALHLITYYKNQLSTLASQKTTIVTQFGYNLDPYVIAQRAVLSGKIKKLEDKFKVYTGFNYEQSKK